MLVCKIPKNTERFFFHIQHKDWPHLHVHDGYWEFMIVTKGTLVHKINGEKYELPQNTLCLIRPNDAHSLHNKKGCVSQHLNLGITDAYFQQYLELLSPNLYQELLSNCKAISLPLNPAATDSFLRSAYKILSIDSADYEQLLTLLFMDVMRAFYSHLVKFEPLQKKYSVPVSLLIRKMCDPENMKTDAESLIAQTNYSYSHMNRIFKKEVGCTPSKYFRDRKFEYAKKLLTETDTKLTDIALLTGYTSYPHFSISFKKYVGVSPCDYCNNKNNYYYSVEEV